MRTTLVLCIPGATKSLGSHASSAAVSSAAPHKGLRSLTIIINRDDVLCLLAVTEEADRPGDTLGHQHSWNWVTDAPGISALCTIKRLPAPSRLAL